MPEAPSRPRGASDNEYRHIAGVSRDPGPLNRCAAEFGIPFAEFLLDGSPTWPPRKLASLSDARPDGIADVPP